MKEIKILHLYSRLLSLYGEYGNADYLAKVLTDNGQEDPQDIQVRDEITPIDPIYLVPIVLVALVLLVALLFLLDGRKRKKGGTLHRGKYEKKHEEN